MLRCVSGRSKIYGVIGNPVEHTLSPELHNTFGKLTKNTLVYVPFKVEKDKVKEALEGLWACNVQGFNVTVPFKQDVIPFLDGIDEEAQRIGAVNTMLRTEKGYKGFNTDINGLHKSITSEGFTLKDEKVIILGAGGGSKAATYMCAREGAKSIYIINRSQETAQSVKDSVIKYYPNADIQLLTPQDYQSLPKDQYIAIQTTPVGMSTYIEQAIIEVDDFYKNIKFAVDMIYEPEETLFLRKVRANGGQGINGLKMLVYQAVLSFEIWTGDYIEDDKSDEILRQLYKMVKGE
ncbi:shikimate dehydrogenase [Natranaerovirga hydrolytica]|uniref:Shikimate dehydrogenase (NADP(+)) n=1 Tax=Natranaerovirga hydrolytica TaxID=680378 RepID=A0A4R1N6V2_9FIRM|nr:shikimate dehydrogenase [Natranaerovirga hydrolytica]TCK98373.1 shikimate dehydrogenase [Natranaerovirga hydrolytica]